MERKAREIFELECRRYLAEIGLTKSLDKKYSVPVAAYVLCTSMALPVKTLMVGERPYSTDIHPSVSSAMSYDPSKTRATPSTMGIAMDLQVTLGCKLMEVERWFRDSWTYMLSGVVIVNCMIECSHMISPSKIDVICMGVPSQNVVDSMLRSMGKLRSIASKKTYPNPAVWSKRGVCDTGSRGYTFGKKGTSQSILNAIVRSKDYPELTIQDYISHMSQPVSKQVQEVGRLLSSGKALVDEIEDAYKVLESNHKTPSLTEAYNEFARCMVEYRDAVLYDLVSSAMAASADSSTKVGRNTEWGSKKQWKKPAPSVGASSKMSALSEEVTGVDQQFADYGGEPVTMVEDELGVGAGPETKDEPLTKEEPPVVEQAKPKKIRVVRRIVKKPRVASAAVAQATPTAGISNTPQGAKLTEKNISSLRQVMYYVSEIETDSAGVLKNDISLSMENGVAKTGDIGTIIDIISRDFLEKGKDVSSSLGLEDGVVSEDCTLPKLIAKLTEG
jgi:hypothetical protein